MSTPSAAPWLLPAPRGRILTFSSPIFKVTIKIQNSSVDTSRQFTAFHSYSPI